MICLLIYLDSVVFALVLMMARGKRPKGLAPAPVEYDMLDYLTLPFLGPLQIYRVLKGR